MLQVVATWQESTTPQNPKAVASRIPGGKVCVKRGAHWQNVHLEETLLPPRLLAQVIALCSRTLRRGDPRNQTGQSKGGPSPLSKLANIPEPLPS